MVRFSLLELKGEYDFNTSNSEYKGDLFIGNAKVCFMAVPYSLIEGSVRDGPLLHMIS